MKILSAQQIKETDAHTILHEPITSINLMERAATACVEWIRNNTFSDSKIQIICGTGNNGGDGLAIARLLHEKRYDTEVFILRYTNKCSADFSANEQKIRQAGKIKVTDINSSEQLVIDDKSIVIDAILGSGLNRPVDGLIEEAIKKINNSASRVIAIDISSGLFSDDSRNNSKSTIIRASHTLTFQTPKLGFMFTENYKYTGNFTVLDIGLDKKFISHLPCINYYITKEIIHKIYKPREKFSHKGTYGHALIIAGSYGKIGACVLAANACLKAGAGLVTAHVPKCGYPVIQTALPEVMASIDSGEYCLCDTIPLEKYNAIGVGPGISDEKQTQNVLKLLIQNSQSPMVFDADAINILSQNKTWISFIPKGSIFTPHPKELERLVGKVSSGYERYEQQKEFSKKHNVYVVLKGAHTSISCPDATVYFNSTGNPGMATAGSGDALTGIITGLLAQGYSSKEACILGVYLHGLAGDIAASKLSEEALMARDIIDNMGEAYLKINSEKLV